VLFYSTDYDELIGMCDRVAIIYRGRVVHELVEADITEANIVAASLSIKTTSVNAPSPTVEA
jgi:ribose transport system ATP-binding protein